MINRIKQYLQVKTAGKRAVLLCTGDNGSTILMDIIKDRNIKPVFIDTGYHFDEIISCIEGYKDRIEVVRNDDAVAEPSAGMSECCRQRKSDVLEKYLDHENAQCLIAPFTDEGKNNGIEDSYLSGINNMQIIRPLADLKESELWTLIKGRDIPFAKIYNKGYKFVDCKCCTTRHGRKKLNKTSKTHDLDRETEEKLKALGYM